jgi:hypothetical protein
VQFSDWAGSSQGSVELISLLQSAPIHRLYRVQSGSGLVVRLDTPQVGRDELTTRDLAILESSVDLIDRGFDHIKVGSNICRRGRLGSKLPDHENRRASV